MHFSHKPTCRTSGELAATVAAAATAYIYARKCTRARNLREAASQWEARIWPHPAHLIGWFTEPYLFRRVHSHMPGVLVCGIIATVFW